MGVDCIGKNPTSEIGKYFHNTWWSWRPLADYACTVAPDITAKCKSWQSNDGDGLEASGAIALADRLQAEIDSGRAENYAQIRASQLERLPNVPCALCEGTGRRKPPPQSGRGDVRTGIKCNGCDGGGYEADWDTYYSFDIDNLKEFVAFLRDSGGFSIN